MARRAHLRILSNARCMSWLLRVVIVVATVCPWLLGAAHTQAQDVRARVQPTDPSSSCARAQSTNEMKQLVQQGAFVDAHMIALTLFIVCPAHPERNAWRLLDGYALLELDETARGRALLSSVAAEDPRMAPAAWTLLAWSHLDSDEPAFFRRAVAHLDPQSRTRLTSLSVVDDEDAFTRETARIEPRLRERARRAHEHFLDRQERNPWVAGILSAILPGAGQLYAGSLESGAIAFTLNAAFIASTVELAVHELYITAAAAGLVSSIFYVGNILNAVDLVNRRNDIASAPERTRLERLLLPHDIGTLR